MPMRQMLARFVDTCTRRGSKTPCSLPTAKGWHGLISAVDGPTPARKSCRFCKGLDPRFHFEIGFAQMKGNFFERMKPDLSAPRSAPRYRPCRNPRPDSVGVSLRRARYALGMTQKELAAHFGVTRETIYRIEGGKRGDRSTKYSVRIRRERMRIWAEINKPEKGIEWIDGLFL